MIFNVCIPSVCIAIYMLMQRIATDNLCVFNLNFLMDVPSYSDKTLLGMRFDKFLTLKIKHLTLNKASINSYMQSLIEITCS